MAVSELFDLRLILVNFSCRLFDLGFSVRVACSTMGTKCPISPGNSWALYKGALSVYILSGGYYHILVTSFTQSFVLI